MDLSEQYLDLKNQIHNLLQTSPKLLILGIGENRMGDDGAGQWITFELDKQYKSSQIRIINGGITPEERLDEIIDFQPELMIVVDVIGSDKPRGSIDFYEEKQMLNYLPISSHSMPLPVFIDRCKRGIKNVTIKLLGINPFSLDFHDRYVLFREDLYTLDDKDNDPNIPFYAFNMTHEILEISRSIVRIFLEKFSQFYKT